MEKKLNIIENASNVDELSSEQVMNLIGNMAAGCGSGGENGSGSGDEDIFGTMYAYKHYTLDNIPHGKHRFACTWTATVTATKQPDGYVNLTGMNVRIVVSGSSRTIHEQDDKGNWVDVTYTCGGLTAKKDITSVSLDFGSEVHESLSCHEFNSLNITPTFVSMDTSITLVPTLSASGVLTLDISGTPSAAIQSV